MPGSDKFGIATMVVASIVATVGALIIGVPIGILTAVFIAEVAPKKVAKIISPAVELLAGIPSVLYGIFGLAVIVPNIQNIFNLPKGQSLLAVIIVLSIMMLPTIISVSETAIRAVPKAYKEGSLALGASKIETIVTVDSVIKEVYCYNNVIALNLGSEVHFIGTNGWLIKKYISNQEVRKIVMNTDFAAVVYRDKVEIINL